MLEKSLLGNLLYEKRGEEDALSSDVVISQRRLLDYVK